MIKKQLFNVQPIEIHVGLGPVGTQKRFFTVDVTKYLEELHAEASKDGMTPLSFTVISGYEAHWEGDRAQTDNVAILQAGWALTEDSMHPNRELEFYCGKLREKFNSIVALKILEVIQVVNYV